jgi:hypothetical protein
MMKMFCRMVWRNNRNDVSRSASEAAAGMFFMAAYISSSFSGSIRR